MINANTDKEQTKKWVEHSRYFDGIVATLNFIPEEFEKARGEEFAGYVNYIILNAHKKEGLIICAPWNNIHNENRNLYLQSGFIRHGDWILGIDVNEYVTENFAKTIRERIEQYERDGVHYMVWGRVYLFKFNNQMLYRGSPHEAPYPLTGKGVSIQDESVVRYDENGAYFGDFIYNAKNFDNSMILSGCRYMLYRISNQVDMWYGKYGTEVVREHESYRQWFLLFCEFELGFIPNMDNIVKYIEQNITNLRQEFIDYAEVEFFMKDILRFKLLKQPRADILKNRHNWSLKEYLRSGDIEQKNGKFIGVINMYNERLNRPHE